MDKILEEMDKEIIALINKRVLHFSGYLKKRGNTIDDIYSSSDSVRISNLIKSENKGLVPDEILQHFYNELISCSVKMNQPFKVAYLGPEGTFSYMALKEVFGSSVDILPQNSIAAVFEDVETGRAAFGIVPVENSTEGSVTYTLDALVETDLKIISEKLLRIKNSLLSTESDLSSIKKVYSHPQPLAQCKNWLKQNVPDALIVQEASTTKAAEAASKEDGSAAIASESAAELYKLNILASNIEDSKNNFTRFFVLGNKENPRTGNDKTSIICSIKDEPGALFKILKPFSDYGINLSKIESRPNKKELWAYNFFIDLIGHNEDKNVKDVLDKLKEYVLFVKVLGSYPINK